MKIEVRIKGEGTIQYWPEENYLTWIGWAVTFRDHPQTYEEAQRMVAEWVDGYGAPHYRYMIDEKKRTYFKRMPIGHSLQIDRVSCRPDAEALMKKVRRELIWMPSVRKT